MNSHKTAISRKTGSRPLRDMIKRGHIKGRVIDYGCGKGADIEYMKNHGINVCGYDPWFFKDECKGLFDVVFCNYVINVVNNEENRKQLIHSLFSKCKSGGYI